MTARQRGIECSRCEKWTHASCGGVSGDAYLWLSEHEDQSWYCSACVVRELPFAEASRLSEWGVNASDDVLDDEDEQTQVGPFQGNDGCLVVSHLNIRSLVHKHDDLQVFWRTGMRRICLG